MNISAGAQRIRKVGLYCLLPSLALFAISVGMVALALLWPSLGFHIALMDIAILPLLLAIPGASLWGIGWIIEGFADKSVDDSVKT